MSENKIYLIGNSHIDPVWQWRWFDGFAEIKATFRSVLDRMNEYPELKFTSACGVYYEWIEKSCPDMFEKIKQRVKEGRWCIAGGWFLQPDCNLPSGESFVRQALVAQRYFFEKFGKYAEIGYNVDSFGHNAGLPQILLKSGLKGYVFMRPSKDEKKEVPANFFMWEGTDGSRIPAYRVSLAYNLDAGAIAPIKEIAEKENADEMLFFGIGNHGGGPSIQAIEVFKKEMTDSDCFKFATVNEFFDEHDTKNLPVLNDDLQFHARGCYSANSEVKEQNRTAEIAMCQAETFSSLSAALVGTEYPQKKYKKAWKNILFNQFHDIMAGCATKPAFKDATYLYGETMSIAEQEINFALQQISWQIDTLKGHNPNYFRESTFFPFVHNELGSPVVVFNSLPYARKMTAQIYPICEKVEDENGNALEMQIVRGAQTDCENIYNTLFYIDVPACGYAVARIFPKKDKVEKPTLGKTDFIENEYLKVTFDTESGAIKSIFDKKHGKELLSAPAVNCVFNDEGYDTWAHNIYSFDNKLGEFSGAEMHLTENGDVRVTMRVTSKYNSTVLRQDYTLYKNSPVLHVFAHVEMLEHKRMLRLAFPVGGKDLHSVTEIPFGVKEHPRDKAEYPCGKWFSLYGEKSGVTVMSKTKSSYGVDNDTAYFTVLRTAAYLDHYGKIDEFCDFLDDGIQEFEYGIMPFESYEDNEEKALEFVTPSRAIMETFHKGKLPSAYAGVEVKEGTAIVSALKKSEDGKAYIVRIAETSGNGTETEIAMHCFNITLSASLKKYEVKTFRIENGKISECNLIENNI